MFFWLMWNDFMIMLLGDPRQFIDLLNLSNHITMTQGALFGTITTLVTFWINPVFSTWSDRTRSKWGRRRPFLFWTTPPMAFFLMLMPYMPTLYHYLQRFPWAAEFFKHVPMSGPIFMIGVNGVVFAVFNAMVLAIFSYLYWDVVPQELLGRFTAMTKIVGSVLGLIWSFFIYGLAEHHMKAVFVCVSTFAMFAYLFSVYKIKEGEWPPPDEHKTGGMFAPVRAYFVECYSKSYYLWIFAAISCAGLSGATGLMKTRYVNFDLHLSWDFVGKLNSAPMIIAIALGYFFGSLTDRFHPVRIMPVTYLAMGATNLGCYFFVTGPWSYMTWMCVLQVATFAQGVAYGALLPEIYPREKLGQFCSAAVLFQMAVGLLTGIPLSMFFDSWRDDRLSYLWTAGFLGLTAILYYKVLRNHTARHGKPPVPHAG